MSGHIGIYGSENVSVAPLLYISLYALQHRGEVGSGMSILNGKEYFEIKGKGLVSDIYKEEDISTLLGNKGLAHVKYAFSEEKEEKIFLPEVFETTNGKSILSIDGNFLEKTICRNDLVNNLEDESNLEKNIQNLKGAYSIIYLKEDFMIGIRDPWGIKGLVLGRVNNSYILASETSGIDSIGGEYIRDLEPGEILFIKDNEIVSKYTENRTEKSCIFDFVYTARQDSFINKKSVYEARYNLGRKLASEHPVNGDVVIGTPDSGTIAALGYSHESRIAYKEGILKNRYVGRTFILPEQSLREKSVKIKMNPLKINLEGKRVILVDDSIVRGTTIKNTVKMLKDANALEVHVRVACPPVLHSCDLCVDTPSEENLISANMTKEETKDYIGADSLEYLSMDGLLQSFGGEIFCRHCFDGNYPIEVNNETNL